MISAGQPPTTFIVRVSRDPAGRIKAVIERVSSGSKVQVDGAEAIGSAISQMLTSDDAVLPRPPALDGPFSKQEPKS